MAEPPAKPEVVVPPDDGSPDTARWYALEGAHCGATTLAELHQTERIRMTCALCGDSFDGPFRDGRAWFAEHRSRAHT